MAAKELKSLLLDSAKDHGFPLAGVFDFHHATSQKTLNDHIRHYDRWLEAGYSGEMEYLRRGRDRRAHPEQVFPGLKSVLSVALPYSPKGVQGDVRYASYLSGEDYHFKISQSLEKVMQRVRDEFEAKTGNDLQWKVCVDTSAVLERCFAWMAGLGWIGKNSLLIHPRWGSYLFLAEVLINHPVGQGPQFLPNYCGHCSRCLDRCPTQAFVEPRILNSEQCISYWTLEKRGPLQISKNQKSAIGNWVAGCDLCQEVCPFNLKRIKTESLASKDAHLLEEWEALLEEEDEFYRKRVSHSALKRVKPHQFRRNLAIALQNELQKGVSISKGLKFKNQLQKKIENESEYEAKLEWLECIKILDSLLNRTQTKSM